MDVQRKPAAPRPDHELMSCLGEAFRLHREPCDQQCRPQDAAERHEQVMRDLVDVTTSSSGLIRIYRPTPTAAFSRRDSQHPGYEHARGAVIGLGFVPTVRPTAGHLAIYGNGSVILDVVSPHRDPRRDPLGRFATMARLLSGLLISLGVDARIGAVDGEYCPGRFSVNAAGQRKLVGLSQRMTANAYYLGAVIAVEPDKYALRATQQAYPLLDLDIDASTFGALAEEVDGISVDIFIDSLVAMLSCELPLVGQYHADGMNVPTTMVCPSGVTL